MKKILNKTINSKLAVAALVILISLGSVYYLLLPGFYEPQDLHHIADIYQMYRSIISGQIPPRWGPDFLYGFGYPLFNFYYIMPFYLGAFIYFLSGSLKFSYEYVFIISVLLGSAGFYLFLRNHFSKIASITALVVLTYTPYKAVQIYVRGSMGELLSISLMPWLFLFVEKYIDSKRHKWLLYSVIAASFIILSHNYFWVLIFGFCGSYFVIDAINKKNFRIITHYLMIILFSMGVTAFWWLPAIIEQPLLKSQTPFPLIDHFPFIVQLILPSWGYGASLWGPTDGMSFQVGLVNIAAILISVIVFIKRLKVNKYSIIFLWSIASAIICLFFMNIRSYPLWKIVPFYNFFQFPWRFLAFVSFFSSVLAGYVVDNLTKVKSFKIRLTFGISVSILSFILTINYFKPSKLFYKNDDEYLARMFADRTTLGRKNDVSLEYVNYSEDYLLLPKWLDKKPDYLPTSKFSVVNPSDITIKKTREISPVLWEADVIVNSPSILNFYSLYFPGWEVKVDKKRTEILKGDKGQISINLNKGDSNVRVYWAETNLRKFADLISLVTIALLIYISWRKSKSFI